MWLAAVLVLYCKYPKDRWRPYRQLSRFLYTLYESERLMAKILVIDDSKDIRDLVKTMLERAGHETAFASNGKDGLRQSQDGTIDVVLLDILMPDVDGITALKDLQSRCPELPVIVMSGGGAGASLEYASALADTHGAAEVLFKPFRQEELCAAVEAALAA